MYDVTEFKEEHPGGKSSEGPSSQGRSNSCTEPMGAVILKWAGKDATETYEPIHPPDTLDKLVSALVKFSRTQKLVKS